MTPAVDRGALRAAAQRLIDNAGGLAVTNASARQLVRMEDVQALTEVLATPSTELERAREAVIEAARRAVESWMTEPGSKHVDRMIELREALDKLGPA